VVNFADIDWTIKRCVCDQSGVKADVQARLYLGTKNNIKLIYDAHQLCWQDLVIMLLHLPRVVLL